MRNHPLLDAAAAYGVRLGLSHLIALLARSGHPQRRVPSFHVAGTNGKGSTTTMLAAALSAAGYRTGSYLSPHLVHINERICVDGEPIGDASLDAALQRVEALRQAYAIAAPITWFEMATLAAILAFDVDHVEAAVYEVGLGGRLDATRTILPLACGLTSVGLDHTDVLGPTLERIAAEKVAIAIPGVPFVSAVADRAAADRVRSYLRAIGALHWEVGRDIRVDAGESVVIETPLGRVGPLRLAMNGAHQARNAAVAVGMLHGARCSGFVIDDAAIIAGLERARLAGRCAQLAPRLFCDGAHNADGSAVLAAILASRPRPERRVLVVGVNAPRDPNDVLAPLALHVDALIATRSTNPSAYAPDVIAEHAAAFGLPIALVDTPAEAVSRALADGAEVWVAGSLYLVGDVYDAVINGLITAR